MRIFFPEQAGMIGPMGIVANGAVLPHWRMFENIRAALFGMALMAYFISGSGL